MNTFILDGGKMTSRQAAHQYLASVLRLPDYYGNNLDALYDCLGEYGPESTVIIRNGLQLENNLGDYGKRLLETFRDAAGQPASFQLIVSD